MTSRELIKAALFFSLEAFQINRFFRYLNRGKIKTLLYHNVCADHAFFSNAITVRQFEKHLKYLKHHCNVATLEQNGEIKNLRPDRVNVLLTFDDGFVNNYQLAYPLLKKAGLSASFFLITETFNSEFVPEFIKGYASAGTPAAELKTLSRQQAAELAAGGMTIGSHSATHVRFTDLSTAQVEEQASRSKKELEAVLQRQVCIFAFPWGHHRVEQLELLKKYYARVFTVEHGCNEASDFAMKRNEVLSPLHMYAAASGALDFFKKLIGG